MLTFVFLFPFAARRLLEISSPVVRHQIRQISFIIFVDSSPEANVCLLYTSDAADDIALV